MLSLSRFYPVLHQNLIKPFNGRSFYFSPFGTYDNVNLLIDNFDRPTEYHSIVFPSRKFDYFHCYFLDQEPFYPSTESVFDLTTNPTHKFLGPNRITVIAHSEKSDIIHDFSKKEGYYNWYYFFHGFAALDWYRDFEYVPPNCFDRFDKVFICYNHLISKYRSYRLHLVSNLISGDLVKFGHVSLQLQDVLGTWKQEIESKESLLSNKARVKIYQVLKNVNQPLVINDQTPVGSLSADVMLDELTSALWHIVTETIYFQPKLHLTEKIFKPIVAKRPFMLVAAPGNLAYLKSYGFRTFDQWIDESYDLEQDHYIRIEKITAEITRLCSMSRPQLEQMHKEMKEVLEYNFDHFYGNFKTIIAEELVGNFEHVLCRINNGRVPNNHSSYHRRYELSAEYLQGVKQRLAR